MVTHYKTQGLVFGREDRAEADRIFTLFTSDFGKVELMGRGIRKITSKLRGGIELFSLSEVEFISSQHRNTLVEAIKIERFMDVARVSWKMEVAMQASSLISECVFGQESDQKMWKFLMDFFTVLNGQPAASKNEKLMWPYFFWNFAGILGYAPQLYRCASCGGAPNPLNLHFSSNEGGLLCPSCAKPRSEHRIIHQDVIKVLRVIANQDWETMVKLKVELKRIEELVGISQEYSRYLLSSRIR
jgi:DNA repair protein RecO (recombination protein O)